MPNDWTLIKSGKYVRITVDKIFLQFKQLSMRTIRFCALCTAKYAVIYLLTLTEIFRLETR